MVAVALNQPVPVGFAVEPVLVSSVGRVLCGVGGWLARQIDCDSESVTIPSELAFATARKRTRSPSPPLLLFVHTRAFADKTLSCGRASSMIPPRRSRTRQFA